MKNLGLFFVIILPFYCFGQVNESFLDGNFINNPFWTGTASNFMVNNALQLQSQAAVTSTSFLFTPSESFDDAVWECWVKITYPTSSYNYASVYIVSDRSDIEAGCNGYYVEIGGSKDEVSLYLQEGEKKTKLIDGVDKRTDGSVVELKIKVTRDSFGNFNLYSNLATESDYVLEGTVQNTCIMQCSYFGLLFSNTGSTGKDYFFDDIFVSGTKATDKVAPQWTHLNLELPHKLVLEFSEAMDFSAATYNVDQGMGSPASNIVSLDKMSVTLTFERDFERSKTYSLEVSGLQDLAGNRLDQTQRSVGMPESMEEGDLVFNEVMFENPENSLEYIEIYNRSDKLLDVSGLVFTTRKTDGSLNTGNKIPLETLLMPKGYLALCADADSVRNYHLCPAESNIISCKWSTLNNESSTLVLTNESKDTIYDELTYDAKWHHVLVKNPKGVALERMNPDLPTQQAESWHSAASDVNYGTPGYQNSQYRDIFSEYKAEKMVWVEPEAFSPDNDGVDDVCFIRYKTDIHGYIANALILNPMGEKVFHVATNTLLSTGGFFSWDGRTDGGKNVNVGIYVLYFELFNPENGRRKQMKLPIVVSSR